MSISFSGIGNRSLTKGDRALASDLRFALFRPYPFTQLGMPSRFFINFPKPVCSFLLLQYSSGRWRRSSYPVLVVTSPRGSHTTLRAEVHRIQVRDMKADKLVSCSTIATLCRLTQRVLAAPFLQINGGLAGSSQGDLPKRGTIRGDLLRVYRGHGPACAGAGQYAETRSTREGILGKRGDMDFEKFLTIVVRAFWRLTVVKAVTGAVRPAQEGKWHFRHPASE